MSHIISDFYFNVTILMFNGFYHMNTKIIDRNYKYKSTKPYKNKVLSSYKPSVGVEKNKNHYFYPNKQK